MKKTWRPLALFFAVLLLGMNYKAYEQLQLGLHLALCALLFFSTATAMQENR